VSRTLSRAGAAKTMNRRTCHFSGHVQGVGFRYTAQNIAMQYNVSGYVRNLDDGRVEMLVEGPDDQIDQVVQGIKQRMEGFIRKVDSQTSPGTGEFKGFSVRH
jgi:acylphosphatase